MESSVFTPESPKKISYFVSKKNDETIESYRQMKSENNFHKFGLTFSVSDEPDQLAIAQIRYFLHTAVDGRGYPSFKINEIVFTEIKAYLWVMDLSTIPLSWPRGLVRSLKTLLLNRTFKFHYMNEIDIPKFYPVDTYINTNTDTFGHIRRQRIMVNGKIRQIGIVGISCLQFYSQKKGLQFDELLSKVFLEFETAPRSILFTNSTQFMGDNLLTISRLNDLEMNVLFSRAPDNTFTLCTINCYAENDYYGKMLRQIYMSDCKRIFIGSDIYCKNIKSIPKKTTDITDEFIDIGISISNDDDYVYFTYKINLVYKSRPKITVVKQILKFKSNIISEFILNMGLWYCLEPYIKHMNSEILKITTDNQMLYKSINNANSDLPITNSFIAVTRKRFHSLYSQFKPIPLNRKGDYELVDGTDFKKNIHEWNLSVLKGHGKVDISLHSLQRFIQREIEANNEIWARPLLQLERVLSSLNWNYLSESEEIRLMKYNDCPRNSFYLYNEESGWILILREENGISILVTVLNTKSPYFIMQNNHELLCA